jgi:tripartite-type tricarboxylate transporter receptor subunit TctC
MLYRLAATIALCALLGVAAQAQSSRMIKFVVPFAPGGTADILARLLAEAIGKAHGVGTLIENRPGAGTIIATEAASRAAPDGNTVLFNANAFVINPHLRKLSYDPLTSFEPICQLVSSPQVIVVGGSAPYRSLAEMFDAARAKPGELTLASVGPASTQHIAFEMLKHLAGVNIIFVPFNGNGPAVNALLGKHVDSILVNYSEVAEQLQDGTFRALATTSRSRIAELPRVPAVAELGFNDFEAEVWFGAVAPAKTPAAVVSELADWMAAALDAPTVKPKLKALGLYTVGRCGAAFAAELRQRFEDYGRAIRESNIRVE